jgi:Transcriptional regulatory protein, C terminal
VGSTRATALPTLGSGGLVFWYTHPRSWSVRYLYVPNKVKSLSEVLGKFWEIFGVSNHKGGDNNAQRFMSEQVRHLYEFGPFRLDATERLLLRDQQHIPLTPKAFETLLVLVEHGGHVIDKTELMKKVWPDTFVEEVNLAKNVSSLRKILGQNNRNTTLRRFRSEGTVL